MESYSEQEYPYATMEIPMEAKYYFFANITLRQNWDTVFFAQYILPVAKIDNSYLKP